MAKFRPDLKLQAETFQFGVAHEYTPAQLHKKLFFSAATCWPSAQWFQMSKIRQNISSPKVISRVFPWKFLQIHITSVSGCLRFTFKICQTVAGTSMISQFHEFFESRFWRVFYNMNQLHYCPNLTWFFFVKTKWMNWSRCDLTEKMDAR